MSRGDDRGWMASLTWWTWVWASSGGWWWTGRPGVLQCRGSQKVRRNWATELNYKVYRKASASRDPHECGACITASEPVLTHLLTPGVAHPLILDKCNMYPPLPRHAGCLLALKALCTQPAHPPSPSAWPPLSSYCLHSSAFPESHGVGLSMKPFQTGFFHVATHTSDLRAFCGPEPYCVLHSNSRVPLLLKFWWLRINGRSFPHQKNKRWV